MSCFRKIIISCCVFAISSCAGKNPEEMSLKPNSSIAVVGVSVMLDEAKVDSGFLKDETCTMQFTNKDNSTIKLHQPEKDAKYAFIDIENGDVINIYEINCLQSKFLYNKIRRYLFENLSAKVEQGKINYLGDLVFDWTPQTFSAGDLFNGIITTSDSGKMVIKRDENLDDFKAYLKKYPNLDNSEIVVKKFNEHKLLIQ